jgi:hypothetical protein
MRSILLTIAVVFLASLASCSERGNVQKAGTPEVLTTTDVDFCELLNSPDKYLNRPVRVRAIFCDCFENAQIFSTRCPVGKKIWADGRLRPCTGAGRIDKTRRESSTNPGDQTFGSWNFGVVAVGRITGTKGGYGHMNAFDYKFEIDCVEHSELLDKIGFRPGPGTEEFRKIETFEAGGTKQRGNG